MHTIYLIVTVNCSCYAVLTLLYDLNCVGLQMEISIVLNNLVQPSF